MVGITRFKTPFSVYHFNSGVILKLFNDLLGDKPLMNDNTITIGNDPSSPYIAYGDESSYKQNLAFAFALVARSNIHRAEKRIKLIKERYKFSADEILHCRVLFNRDAREKHNLDHLTKNQVFELIEKVVTVVNKIPILLRYSYYQLPTQGHGAEDSSVTIEFSNDQRPTIDTEIHLKRKGLLGLLMQSCFLIPSDGSKGPPASQCQIIISEEKTKTRFLGQQKRKAHRWATGFSDVGAPDGKVFKIEPTVAKANDHELLQVADVLAYICSHAISGEDSQAFFKRQLGRIKYWTRSVLPPGFPEIGNTNVDITT